ncbi:hypothetical protein HNQ93_001253 [Hymenobacter luteus]|uniref:Uncharacterized protein n=2 Tax=Hymenobacter TaxID=89966 RepID=A0A7W9SYS8_9BACT|nr:MULTISPECIES: hypothetical protein [Hymenobacter]MBB4601386.1 hypothetical protein [Hymenobacter latericoloratus]MBB6058407.1 hypothetical protein [Hymenobacter luteus]
MKKNVINIPRVRANGKPLLYLSQIEGFELPKGILAKGGTGVGGSTLAIDSKHPYIIAVPTTALIENKMEKHPDVFGVYYQKGASVNPMSLSFYLEIVAVPVIMVTYDSLHKVTKELQDLGIDVYNHFRLLVDEYTELLKAYSYRNKAINSLVKEASKFNYTTYMSATPIDEQYTPKVFKELEYTELLWEDVSVIKPVTLKTAKPYHSVSNIIKRFKANGYAEKIGPNITNELFVYVNSVIAIKDIIDNTNLVPSEVKIICADTLAHRDLLGEYSIAKPIGDNKPINFLTSKAFSGCDIYSNNGLAIVVSNVQKKHTLVDIATDVYQIAGRIRTIDNPFKDTIIHIYNTGAIEMNKKDFEDWVNNKKISTKLQLSVFNKFSSIEKEAFKKRMEMSLEDDYLFYNEETNQLEYDDLKEMSEAFEFSITNEIYSNGLSVRNAYLKQGYDVVSSEQRVDYEEAFVNAATKLSFKEIMKEYISLMKYDASNERIPILENLEPEIKKMYEVLGAKKIETSRYSQKAIKELMYSESREAKDAVKHSVYTRLKKGGFYSSNEIIDVLEEAYKRHKIIKKAKSKDITEFLPAKKKQQRDSKTGKPITGYIIDIE